MNKTLTIGLGACLLCAPTLVEAKKSPNVIVILVDDLGYGDLSCYGATKIETPNMDRLAEEGRKFTDAHASASVSNASRYGLLTGEYPSRAGIWAPTPVFTTSLIKEDQTTIADVMKAGGYSTAAIGKWHLGFQTGETLDYNKPLKPGPLELGFDYYFGVPLVNSGPPFVYVENHEVVGYTPDDPFVYGDQTLVSKTEVYPDKTMGIIGGADEAHLLYRDREVGTTLKDKAIDWIKENKKKPFFLYYATTNIHHPFTPAEQFVGKSKIGMYGDFLLELDWIVGEVVQTLEDEGIADNTMIILTSDNGGMFNIGGQEAWKAGHAINGELWGFKFDSWEGGHRVPFIVKWPKVVEAGSVTNTLTSNVDIFAMLSSLTGYKMKSGDAPDSFDLLPAIKGKENVVIRDHILVSPRQPKNMALRKDDWVYIPSRGGGGFSGSAIGGHGFGGYATIKLTKREHSDALNAAQNPKAPKAQLYNLKSDPYQRNNVYNDYPEVVAEMDKMLKELSGEGKSTRPN